MRTDALSQILDVLRMRGTVYFHTHFTPPWGVQVPNYRSVARFHVAIRGHSWIRIEGVPDPIFLSTGDLIVIPHGTSHILSDRRDGLAEQVDEVISRTGYNGEGALIYGGAESDEACKLFCGHFEFDEAVMHPLLSALPSFILIPNTQTMNSQWLESIIRFVSSEVVGDRAGADAIVYRLTEIIFIQVIRAFVDQAGDAAGCLAGVLDSKLSKSLAAVHLSPEKAWTVENMAVCAGMSRTQFSERFTALVGVTPLAYVTQWRMQLARRQVIESDRPLIRIAESIGYGSETAFSRAFKRHFLRTPNNMRSDPDHAV